MGVLGNEQSSVSRKSWSFFSSAEPIIAVGNFDQKLYYKTAIEFGKQIFYDNDSK